MDLKELIQAVSFEPTDFIQEIDTFPFDNSPVGHGICGDDLNKENPIISSQYHHHFGHCITIDISNLSKNDGRYLMKIGSQKLVLHMLLKPIIGHARPSTRNFIFIHDGSNINQFGEKIQERFIHSGIYYHVRYIIGPPIIYSSLMADLRQGMNRVSSFSRCLKETFP